jgi:hypothetical protein
MSPPSTPRDPDSDAIRRDYEVLTHDAAAAAGPHPDEETWVRLASGQLSGSEQARLVDHVLSCAECQAVYRAVSHVRQGASSFDPAAPRQTSGATVSFRRPLWSQALAASLTIAAAGLLAWNLTLQRRTSELQTELERASRAPAAPPQAVREVAPPRPAVQAHVNVPIVDLHPPSRVRGEGARQRVISLQTNVALVTLIVNTDRPPRAADYTLDLLDARGTAVWTGTGLAPQGDGTLSVALPATLLRAGDYVFVLEEGGRTIHRYPVTIAAR